MIEASGFKVLGFRKDLGFWVYGFGFKGFVLERFGLKGFGFRV